MQGEGRIGPVTYKKASVDTVKVMYSINSIAIHLTVIKTNHVQIIPTKMLSSLANSYGSRFSRICSSRFSRSVLVRAPSSTKNIHTTGIARAKLYSDKHEWVEVVDKNIAKVGITQYAADALGDVVYAQLPEVGRVLRMGDECGALESVKAASEIYSPVSGTVIASNEVVEDKPALINTSSEEAAWLFQLDLSDTKELDTLMEKEKYLKFLESITDDIE